ncbi:hypothetical protein L3Q82_011355 [Scortum barcoo]|uniref:Uncharacterized protein n=1 Tax=Scortum barcoo TaxID=214431 RepID=A0ACB8WBD9_9TELE|nr:hypothetical protein L3Q82_011355 [Scortum barcoo]
MRVKMWIKTTKTCRHHSLAATPLCLF